MDDIALISAKLFWLFLVLSFIHTLLNVIHTSCELLLSDYESDK